MTYREHLAGSWKYGSEAQEKGGGWRWRFRVMRKQTVIEGMEEDEYV